ncbi:MAG: protocatechuate 3,4-dioxygenase subunit alpha [Micromonosporaceae bacterium]|jgi:protocatechuate 3,4-dioxygenase alpha subunit|nr:protocatechuate 3,4-dioxygenase subunit alpha [Micromonosporaceae bacterium]
MTATTPGPAGSARLGLTPSQTVGPFLHIGLPWPDGPYVVPEGTPGAIRITGQVIDGAGEPVPDAIVETWQADPDGRFAHPDDPRGAQPPALDGFRGFGRCPTDAQGRYEILTVKPGPLPAPEGGMEAPHLNVSVFSRGLLDRLVTRIYFPDEAEANAADPVLNAVPESRRGTLVATPDGAGLRFDIRMQGENETVFFAV